MDPVVRVLGILTLVTGIGILGSVSVLLLGKLTGREMREIIPGILYRIPENYTTQLGFLIALTATSGSLYLSNVLGWEPCRLCWFQRIFMYPLVLIFAVSWLRMERVREYVMPLAATGLIISIVHYAQQRVAQFSAAGCSVFSVSCSTEYTFQFGYITIPMMAMTAFLAILVLMYRFDN